MFRVNGFGDTKNGMKVIPVEENPYFSLLERRMVLGNPVFDMAVKLGRLDKDLLRFSFGCNIGEGVVDSVSLPPTGLEIVDILMSWLAEHKLGAFQREPVMSDLAHDPIPGTRNCHVCRLECSVVSGRKFPVCRKTGNCRVCQVAGDQGAPVVQFLLGSLVSLGFLTCQ